MIIDLEKEPWRSLRIDNITPIIIREQLQPCTEFPDGLFPGAKLCEQESGLQETELFNFQNYFEYSKIIECETLMVGKHRYLTSQFFINRNKGWSNKKFIPKTGKIVGYCINGYTYSGSGEKEIQHYICRFVYSSLISNEEAFIELQSLIENKKETEFIFQGRGPEASYTGEILQDLLEYLYHDSKLKISYHNLTPSSKD